MRDGHDREVIGRNIAELVKEGYAQKQAIAIAYRSARLSWRRENPKGRLPDRLKGRVILWTDKSKPRSKPRSKKAGKKAGKKAAKK